MKRSLKTPALTPDEFRVAYDRLFGHRDRTGRSYVELMHRLAKFFKANVCGADAESLADEVMDRVFRKALTGEVLDAQEYAHGVARYVLRERWHLRAPDPVPVEDLSISDAGVVEREERRERDRLLDQLDWCLAQLRPEDRALLLEYYSDEDQGVKKLLARQRMAAQIGVSPGNLRVRVYRLRASLRSMLEKKMQEDT